MEKDNAITEEERMALRRMAEIEDLVEKKTKIHSRLLMDAAIAKDMEELSLRHEKRKERLCMLGLGKGAKKQNGDTMSALKGEETEK